MVGYNSIISELFDLTVQGLNYLMDQNMMGIDQHGRTADPNDLYDDLEHYFVSDKDKMFVSLVQDNIHLFPTRTASHIQDLLEKVR